MHSDINGTQLEHVPMSLSLSSGYCSHIHSAPYNNICTTHEWETETVVSSSIYPKNITNAAPKVTGLIHCHAKALDNIFVLSHTPETRSKRIVYITHQPACLFIQMHYWSTLFPVSSWIHVVLLSVDLMQERGREFLYQSFIIIQPGVSGHSPSLKLYPDE